MAARKKGHPKFNVPNYGAKSRKHVKARWRKQRGIDNKKRVKKAHMGAEPTIGYRNPESVRHVRGSGRRAFLVRGPRDLEEFDSRKLHSTHEAVIAHALSRRGRRLLLEDAKRRGITVSNPGREEPAPGKEKLAAGKDGRTADAKQGQGAEKPKGKEGALNEH